MNRLPTKRKRILFTIDEESLSDFYAMIHAVSLYNKKDGRFDISLAFKNPVLVTLAKEVGWLGFKPCLISEIENTQVIDLTPVEEKVKYWQKIDQEDEFEYRKKKYPMIDPEKLAVPDLQYSRYLSILRDVADIFDMEFEHPLQLLGEARNVKFISTSNTKSALWQLLNKNNIKSGPFTLIEEGFVNWTGQEVKDWGRPILLPSPEDLLKDEKSLLSYVGALSSHACAAIGIKSTDYVGPTVASYHLGTPVVWDLRPSSAKPEEDLHSRVLSTILLPESKNILSPNIDPEGVPISAVNRELAFAISKYYSELKGIISQGRMRPKVERPATPTDYVWEL